MQFGLKQEAKHGDVGSSLYVLRSPRFERIRPMLEPIRKRAKPPTVDLVAELRAKAQLIHLAILLSACYLSRPR